MLRALVVLLALLNVCLDAALIMPNLYFWALYHQWYSMAAMIIIGSLGAAIIAGAAWAWRMLPRWLDVGA